MNNALTHYTAARKAICEIYADEPATHAITSQLLSVMDTLEQQLHDIRADRKYGITGKRYKYNGDEYEVVRVWQAGDDQVMAVVRATDGSGEETNADALMVRKAIRANVDLNTITD